MAAKNKVFTTTQNNLLFMQNGEFFESINACAIFMLEVHQFERIKLCVAMVTMWPKRQQSDIKFYTKNEFIKISFGQSF